MKDNAKGESKRQKQEDPEEKKVPRVPFGECVEAWVAAHVVDGWRWDYIDAVSPSAVSTRFANFPLFLLMQT